MKAAPITQAVSVRCACGKVHHWHLGHYGRGLAPCGRIYWALQPERSGELVMFPWPGPNLSAQELAEKERAEKEHQEMEAA